MKAPVVILTLLALATPGLLRGAEEASSPSSDPAPQRPTAEDRAAQPNGEARKRFQLHFKDLTPEQREQMKDFVRRMRDLPPEQRAAEAAKHPFFQQMTPKRQQATLEKLQRMPSKPPNAETNRWSPLGRSKGDPNDPVRQRMRERWKNLPPEQKQQIREFSKQAQTMTPEQRREAMKKLPYFKDLTPDERQVLQKRLQRFHGMDPQQRQKIMKNYERWQKMTPEEREAARQRFQEMKKAGPPPSSETTPPSKAPAPSPAF